MREAILQALKESGQLTGDELDIVTGRVAVVSKDKTTVREYYELLEAMVNEKEITRLDYMLPSGELKSIYFTKGTLLKIK